MKLFETSRKHLNFLVYILNLKFVLKLQTSGKRVSRTSWGKAGAAVGAAGKTALLNAISSW